MKTFRESTGADTDSVFTMVLVVVVVRGEGVVRRGRPTGLFSLCSPTLGLAILYRPREILPLPLTMSLPPLSIFCFLLGGSSTANSRPRDFGELFMAAASFLSRAGSTLTGTLRVEESTGVSSSRGVGINKTICEAVRAGQGNLYTAKWRIHLTKNLLSNKDSNMNVEHTWGTQSSLSSYHFPKLLLDRHE